MLRSWTIVQMWLSKRMSKSSHYGWWWSLKLKVKQGRSSEWLWSHIRDVVGKDIHLIRVSFSKGYFAHESKMIMAWRRKSNKMLKTSNKMSTEVYGIQTVFGGQSNCSYSLKFSNVLGTVLNDSYTCLILTIILRELFLPFTCLSWG
jgi:hypothetical protein